MFFNIVFYMQKNFLHDLYVQGEKHENITGKYV